MDPSDIPQEILFRKIFGWVILIGTTIWGLTAGIFLGRNSFRENSWLVDLIQKHFAALICVPMAALMAMCVVILLRYSSGPIVFKVPGFDSNGPASELAFWVVCFLAIITAIKLLWK